MSKRPVKIKDTLERLYEKYNHRECIKQDPLQFVYRYKKPADMEVAGLLSAALAYGRVRQIERNLNDLFSRMGASPYAFVLDFDKSKRQKLSSFKHRFTTGDDIADLLSVLQKVLQEKDSLEKQFLLGYEKGDESIVSALTKFCGSLYEIFERQAGREVSRGVKYLLASPAGGSACKRLNLFLRWMVRADDVDAGLWKGVDKAKLIVPVDVHMGRLCKILGLYDRKTVSLASAVEITRGFAEICPADPVKYDFALSRVGITEGCNGKYELRCEECELLDFCR